MRVGEIEVVALSDAEGTFKLAAVLPGTGAAELAAFRARCPEAFADEATWQSNFGCFLVRAPGRTLLVDTGVGPGPVEALGGIGGDLPGELRRRGIDPGEVDAVVLTHLHLDHVGWNLTPERRPTFPNARYVMSRADWDFFHLSEVQAALPAYVGPCLTPLQSLGLLDLIEGETALTEEVRAIPTPGHTPGHMSVLLASGGEEALILGDVAAHPAMVTEEGWCYVFEAEPEQAVATRRQVLDSLVASGTRVLVGHYPAPSLGRIVSEGGRRYWVPA